MGAKAYKLTIPQLKSVCDFLTIDRANHNSKDALVDALLDFLGEPEESYLKGSKKSSSSANKRQSRGGGKGKTGKAEAAAAAEPEKDGSDYSDVGDDQVEEDVAAAAKVTDEALRKWVRAYVRCHNMKKSTIKQAIEIASEKFGVDVSDKKNTLKELLTEEM
jgi:hypothetical protein